ncbi:hypothetical protein [Bacteroides fragilis]|uniref:hypothetical protein n=1 Tax=Bacteroides fragilis TaxID=817 RepID=UPI00202E1BB4|nr:hypothetical protein [Bacteroides fragilis]MCM0314273.1 hypothetical protein [Bacteroides fragilis]
MGNKELDQNFFLDSMKQALKVEFITNSEELHLYAAALYDAMIWSRDIDRENDMIQEKCTSVK